MSGKSRTLMIVAVAVCAAAGLGIWRAVDDPDPAGAAGIRNVLQRNQDELMSMEGVVGVGIGEQAGEQVIQVYLADPSASVSSALPDTIDGYAVITQVTGPVVAQPSAGGGEPGASGSVTSGSSGGSEPGAAGTTTAVPIEPGIGDGSGSAAEPGAQTGLDVRGAVTTVAIFDVTDPAQRAVGSLLIEGPVSTDANYDKASVAITKDTHIFAQVDGHVQEVHPELTDLQDKRVAIGFTGPVAESYPVQATAAWVTIL